MGKEAIECLNSKRKRFRKSEKEREGSTLGMSEEEKMEVGWRKKEEGGKVGWKYLLWGQPLLFTGAGYVIACHHTLWKMSEFLSAL